jgi:tRNA1(Val) A37 N6-methylase TrmN6
MIDPHYTPKDLADRLVNYIKKKKALSIADFCVGEGDLLKAANTKWASAKFYGNDISSQVIRLLKIKYPDWILGNCDFLNPNSRNRSIIFKRKYDVILLNPPFTCKGSTIQSVLFEKKEYHVSTAMAYLLEAIKYLNVNGVIYAILPQSIAYSRKDDKIRAYLKNKYYFKFITELNNQWFKKCAPNIVLASINDKNIVCLNQSFKKMKVKVGDLTIQRGRMGMYKIDKNKKCGIPLVHTTNIINGRITGIKYKVNKKCSRITGPAILVNRVGQPSKEKVCILLSKEMYAISDCIIGIKLDNISSCHKLKKMIIDNWSDFSNLYKGTGAKYITINRLKYFLNCGDK